MTDDDARAIGFICFLLPLSIVWFAVNCRAAELVTDGMNKMVLTTKGCSPSQLMPPAAVAAYLNVPQMTVAELQVSNYSWYLDEWRFNNAMVYDRPGPHPAYINYYLNDLHHRALCPVSRMVKTDKYIAAVPSGTTPNDCTSNNRRRLRGEEEEEEDSSRRRLQSGSRYCAHIHMIFDQYCLDRPDAPPFKNPNLNWWNADELNLYQSAAALSIIGSLSVGIFFPFPMVASGLYFAILYYIVRMQSPSTIDALQVEMFPSCAVSVVPASTEYVAIVIFCASSMAFVYWLPCCCAGTFFSIIGGAFCNAFCCKKASEQPTTQVEYTPTPQPPSDNTLAVWYIKNNSFPGSVNWMARNHEDILLHIAVREASNGFEVIANTFKSGHWQKEVKLCQVMRMETELCVHVSELCFHIEVIKGKEDEVKEPLTVGSSVQCKWKNNGQYYDAVIIACQPDGTYDIQWTSDKSFQLGSTEDMIQVTHSNAVQSYSHLLPWSDFDGVVEFHEPDSAQIANGWTVTAATTVEQAKAMANHDTTTTTTTTTSTGAAEVTIALLPPVPPNEQQELEMVATSINVTSEPEIVD